jgi:O-antigen/teichoic acid export membrane protein
MLAARPVILLLYGSAFEGAVVPFQVLLLGVFAIGIRRILADGLSGLGKPQYSGIGHGVALAVMVLLLWILVPTGGIGGAVWAVAIAHWVNLLVTAGLFWMERKRVLTSGVLSES